MLFSEAQGEWRPVSQWIEYLIYLGYVWPRDVSERRRIAIISMPCDSAAAGLVSLGALIRDLERPDANDIVGHYDALLRYARQYLESCRDCTMRCFPDRRGCGYVQEAKGRLMSVESKRKFMVSDATNFAARNLAFISTDVSRRASTLHHSPVTELLIPQYAARSVNFYIQGQPPPQIGSSAQALVGDVYAKFVPNVHPDPSNLTRSYSGLCLAGRAAGKVATRHICASIHFMHEGREHNLWDLLTLGDSQDASAVSRMSFFNTRTEHFDRHPISPSLVVADGGPSFLRVLGQSCFQHSNVLAIIHRTMERDDLEDVGNRIAGLRQWYADDSEMSANLPGAPRGVTILTLRKSSA